MRAAIITTIFTLATAVIAAPVPAEKRGSWHPRSAKITWYSGNSLSNPYCGGPTPTDQDMVAATGWDSPYGCGDTITFDYYGHKATVTVVDKCEGCHSGAWFDISKAAFSKLADLEVGELINVDFYKY
ncbi:hypothetical protein ACI68E_001464 [Malassezia pachydermatis]|uniref:RlpA-like protein double-psi beta-barrel domain-containing protein n=1 Tax=Malassezia pachydermatis TaxID=77020 RepID=A0A0M8MTF6_9BASI|nr:hypothetical protein Malapachy_3284 [Malassezia pachydermatis]KOS16387.1 hypothetical protein Malapachy_3284 [Malassezia pachydermatis]